MHWISKKKQNNNSGLMPKIIFCHEPLKIKYPTQVNNRLLMGFCFFAITVSDSASSCLTASKEYIISWMSSTKLQGIFTVGLAE